MTNAMIILLESVKLMEQGILSGTGEIITVEYAGGEKHEVEIPEPIHTFAEWKVRGFSVKKGEHAIAKFPIWKHTEKQTEDGETKTNMFLKTAAFFKAAQVEPIEKEG